MHTDICVCFSHFFKNEEPDFDLTRFQMRINTQQVHPELSLQTAVSAVSPQAR